MGATLKPDGRSTYPGVPKPHLDEFVFRFHRRRTPQAVFRTLPGIGIAIKPSPHNRLIAPEAPR